MSLKRNLPPQQTRYMKFISPLFKNAGWLSVLLWVAFVAPAQALELRVAIKKGMSQIKVGSSTPAIVTDAGGRQLGTLAELVPQNAQAGGRGVTLGQWQSNQLIIEPSGDGVVWIGDRWYRGRTRLIRQGRGVTAINQVNLEKYLYSVVGGEAIPTWPQEALKAQAVAARTYAIYKSTAESNRFYDLDTTTATQVYKGMESEYVSTLDAVNATEGQVMTYNGKVILAAFHAASGGHTENVEDVWTSPLPYLRGVVDYDQTAPVYQWTKNFSASQLSKLIGGVGAIRSMIPERMTPQGRIVTMRIVGSRGSKQLTGAQIRASLKLRSTLFTVANSGGTFSVAGKGSGHGLGLSQWGAYALSEKNVPYSQILSHYYQNASLTQLGR